MKKIFISFNAIILLLACFHIAACNSWNSQNSTFQAETDSIIIKTYKIQNGWGYDIYVKGVKYIHQETIPAINSNKPFKVKEDAEKIAELVKLKIKKSIFPPSITIFELDSIGINRY